MGEDKLHAAIDSAYAAALGTAPWKTALEALSSLVGGVGTTLELHDARRRELLLFEHTPLGGEAAYQEHYHAVCPRIRALPVGEVDFDHRFYDERDMNRDEFYSDFLTPWGLRYFVSATLINNSAQRGLVTVQLERTRGHVNAADIANMKRVAPHFRRALEVHDRLAGTDALAHASKGAIDKLRTGVVLLDRNGRAVHANPVAERLLEQQRGLELIRRRLVATAPTDAMRLADIVAATVATDVPEARGGAMVIGSEYAPRSLALIAVPLAGPQLRVLLARGREAIPVAAVFIADATAKAEFPVGLLVDAYQLTPAEAAVVVAFAGGSSLHEIAAAAGVTIHTTRSQFAAARAKLEVRSQTELVALIHRLSSPLAP